MGVLIMALIIKSLIMVDLHGKPVIILCQLITMDDFLIPYLIIPYPCHRITWPSHGLWMWPGGWQGAPRPGGRVLFSSRLTWCRGETRKSKHDPLLPQKLSQYTNMLLNRGGLTRGLL